MAENIHDSEGRTADGSQGDRPNGRFLRWLTRLVIGLLGLSAAARSALASQAPEAPDAVPEEFHPPDAEEVRYPDGRIEHPHVRYERRDASLRWIIGIGITAMALAALIHYVLLLFFFDYRNYQDAIKRSPFPLAPAPSAALPASPHLEQLDRAAGIERPDVYEREAAKENVLHSYGATPEQGFVHIPIERAMEEALRENKLPARPERPANQTRRENGLVDSGESNSGRMFREKPRWYEH
jgi:hypothetical protein